LAAPHFHGILILVTYNKFIAGVIVTSDNCLSVFLSLAINLLSVTLSPAIIVHWCLDTGDKFIAVINNTGDH
jgi:hypothetical protein